jgi:hypothetical protein
VGDLAHAGATARGAEAMVRSGFSPIGGFTDDGCCNPIQIHVPIHVPGS